MTTNKSSVVLWLGRACSALYSYIALFIPFVASLVIWTGLAFIKVLQVWNEVPWSVFTAHHLRKMGDSWWPARWAMFTDYLLEFWFIPVGGAAFSYLVHLMRLKTSRPMQESSDASTTGNADELTKLHTLFKDGALTQEEFEQEKKKLLKAA